MKKEYLILALVILALGAYLVLNKENRSHYTLPDPPAIEAGKIDRIVIHKQALALELTQEAGAWVVTEKKFPADLPSVNNMLDVIRNLKISALISETKDLVRYELDEAHRIEVKAFQGPSSLMEFSIGKTAPSLNHTFVMLADDTRIYQADKSFTKFFDKSVEDLRDKQVLNFKQDSIQKITLEKDGVSKVLRASPPTDDKEKISWKFEDDTAPDRETVTNLLSSLSFLACQGFSDTLSKQELEKQIPLAKITLENEIPMVLNIFKQDPEEAMLGTSSMSPYAFVLESFKARDILTYVDKLAELEKKEPPQE